MIAQIIPIIKVIRGRLSAILHHYISVDWTLACYFLLPLIPRPLCKLFRPNRWCIDCVCTICCLISSWALLLELWGWNGVSTNVLFASAHRQCLTGFGWWQSHLFCTLQRYYPFSVAWLVLATGCMIDYFNLQGSYPLCRFAGVSFMLLEVTQVNTILLAIEWHLLLELITASVRGATVYTGNRYPVVFLSTVICRLL